LQRRTEPGTVGIDSQGNRSAKGDASTARGSEACFAILELDGKEEVVARSSLGEAVPSSTTTKEEGAGGGGVEGRCDWDERGR
jgi:hypothetical protein